MAQKMLSVLLASWLVVVAHSASVAPKDDGGDEPPPPPSDDLLQEEIFPDQLPVDLHQQLINYPTLKGFNFPALAHGEPQHSSPAEFSPRGRRPGCFGGITCNQQTYRYKLDEFPPAQPSLDNINNICAEGRKKPSYGPWNLPQTGFSHLMRQGEALNTLETSMDQCCQLSDQEKVPCCSKAWESTLIQYCKQEYSVKTRPHVCCKKNSQDARLTCFASMAPYPAYDKELTSVNLANITPSLLGTLCGQFTLLTNMKPVPALVQNITEPCCQLEGEERIQCAEEGKSAFIANLCSSQKKTWNDYKRCCAQEGGEARVACFNLNYLNNVALGTVEQQVPPTKPAV